MKPDRSQNDHNEPTLPPYAPRVLLSAPAGHPTARSETTSPILLVGSRADCDLTVRHGEISKVHCAIVNTGDAILVADLCSRFGTQINDCTIRSAVLRPGDVLHVGPIEIAVLFEPGSEALCDAQNMATGVGSELVLFGDGRRFTLNELPAVIGRRQSCAVVLDTPDVSLAHSLIFRVGSRPVIADLGSRSGTILNGECVSLAWLVDGDQLTIGGKKLTVGHESSAGSASGSLSASVKALPASVDKCDRADSERLGDFASHAKPGVSVATLLQSAKVSVETVEHADRATQVSPAVPDQLVAGEAEVRKQLAELEVFQCELDRRERGLDEREAELERRLRAVALRERQLTLEEEDAVERRSRADEKAESESAAAAAQAGEIEEPKKQAAPSQPASGEPAEDPSDALPAPIVLKPLFTPLGRRSSAGLRKNPGSDSSSPAD